MKKVVRYATLFREPGPGAVPKDGLICCGYTRGITPKGFHAWGWADFDRELTEKEISDYELEYIHTLNLTEEGKNA